MITLLAAGPNRLQVALTAAPDEVQQVLDSLLGVRFNPRTATYFVPVYDFPILKEKLDRLGVRTGRKMDDAAWEMIRAYEWLLEANARIKAGEFNVEIESLVQRAGITSQLWVDQVADVRFMLRHLRAGNWGEMGVGKTACLLATFALLRLARLARYALVICPNSVKQTWLRQVRLHTTLSAVELGNGSSAINHNLYRYLSNRTDLCIVHYEALRDDRFRDKLVALPFDVVICDEMHLAKNMPSQRTQALLDTLARLRASVSLVEADVELADGTMTKAVLSAGVKPGDVVEFW